MKFLQSRTQIPQIQPASLPASQPIRYLAVWIINKDVLYFYGLHFLEDVRTHTENTEKALNAL